MTSWYYYNENGEKIEVSGKELKELAGQGAITPETVVETHDGRTGLAKNMKGLILSGVMQTSEADTGIGSIFENLDEKDFEQFQKDFERLKTQQEQQHQREAKKYQPPPLPPHLPDSLTPAIPEAVDFPMPEENQTISQTRQKTNILKRGIICCVILFCITIIAAGIISKERYRILSPDIVSDNDTDIAANPEASQEEFPEIENVVENITTKEPEQRTENSQPKKLDEPPFQSDFKNIFEASSKGTVQDVEYFVKKGVDIEEKDRGGYTPLHRATQSSSNECGNIEILYFPWCQC